MESTNRAVVLTGRAARIMIALRVSGTEHRAEAGSRQNGNAPANAKRNHWASCR